MYNFAVKNIKYTTPLILSFLGFLIYSNTMHGPFIFDDEKNIVNNYQTHNISNFLKDFSGARYIAFLSFAINYYFGGLNTFGYHVVNVIIHILNAILVYILIQAMGNRLEAIGKPIAHSPVPSAYRLLPIACSLIFLVHPIQTQAVSYITQRFTSLATFFYLLALVLYVKYRLWAIGNGQWEKPITYRLSPIAYCLSLISAILAMKTKEISFTLPFVIVLYEFTFFKNNDSRPTTLNSRLKYLIPYLLTLLVIPLTLLLPEYMGAFLTGNGEGEIMREKQLKDIATIPATIYLLTQFKVIITYIRLLFFPANQTFWYDYPLSYSISEPAAFLSFIFLLAIFSFSVYLYFISRKAHNTHGLLISFGILWFFITLSIESSIIPITDVIFEHRIYLPSIGFILSVTTIIFYGFVYLEKKTKRSLIYHLFFIILIVSAVFSFLTYKRNIIWGDKFMMYADNAIKSPNRPIIRYNLGVIYYNQGRLDEALNEWLTLTLNPYNPYNANAHNNIGNIYIKKGRVDEAIEEYKSALRINPNHRDARYNLGNTYYNQGMLDEAISEYKIALTLSPNDANLYNILGNIYVSKDQFDEAIKNYLNAIKINPDYADAHYNLGNAYFNQGQLDRAIKEYLTVLKLNPNDADAHNNLGFTYAKKGLKEDARKEFEMALKLKPDLIEARKALEELNRETR